MKRNTYRVTIDYCGHPVALRMFPDGKDTVNVKAENTSNAVRAGLREHGFHSESAERVVITVELVKEQDNATR